jgi:protein tyrosine phosphatase
MESYATDVTVSDTYLQEEYRLLGQHTTPRPRTEAEYNHAHASATLPCNKTKNRYTDVLPVEATRIKLAPRGDEPGSDYINANIVTDPTPVSRDGSEGNDIYICAQAPLQTTLSDFWRMVWEQDVCMIVVLMRLSENGKVKGHRYWPKRSKRVLQFGEVTVTLVKGKHFPHRSEDPNDPDSDQTTIRVLELRRGNERRNIVQLHFKDWPDFGVPESTDPIRNLVKIMEFYRSKARVAGIKGPVVIHCSAGIGRTGTYLAIVFALNAIKHLNSQEANGSSEGEENDYAEGAFHSESPSYSDDEYLADRESRVATPQKAKIETNGEKQHEGDKNAPSSDSPNGDSKTIGGPHNSLHSTTQASPFSSGVTPNQAPKSATPITPKEFLPASSHPSTPNTTSSASSPSTTITTATKTSAPPSPAPVLTGRNHLTGSADSVEYETSLILDEDDDDEGSSYESSDSEEDERDMMHIRSYQRQGSTIPVDIMKIVLSLRKQRNRGMVQTEDQYKFIYRVVLDEIHQRRLNVGTGVLEFMNDAANDFTDSAPLSARLSNSRRKSQPRSPRSTQVSLGSSVSIGASGMSRLSSSTISSNVSGSSFSDDESERKASRLRSSGDSSGPLLLPLDASVESPVFIQKRNLAMSSAAIQPLTESIDSSLSHPSSSSTATEVPPSPVFRIPTEGISKTTASILSSPQKSPQYRRSSPPGVTFSSDLQ